MSRRFFAPASYLCAVLSAASSARAVDYVNDVAPLMSRHGCNGSACHGKAEGQNGFKLSIFGSDPVADHAALTIESRGRRVAGSAPEMSLLLQKITGELPHEGGVRAERGGAEWTTLRDWIAAGAPYADADRPALVELRLEPARKVVAFGETIPLRAVARHADGSERDVTSLAVFIANDAGLADVTEEGVASIGKNPGLAAVLARYQGQVAVFQAVIPQKNGAVPSQEAKPPVLNEIDRFIDANLAQLNIRSSALADDATFLRRAFLDVVGRLPRPDEARTFLADQSESGKKRAALVNRLLELPEYADYWALKWSDLLRVDRERLGMKDAHDYYEWIRGAMAENRPLDRFARDLLLAEGPLAESPAGHFYRVAKQNGETAAAVSQVFLGVRIACAECHQHPWDRWTQRDYHGMRAFFEQVKPKTMGDLAAVMIEGSPQIKHPRTNEAIHPYALGTAMPEAAPEGDRRRVLADWLTAPDNPWFARNLANRVWAHFLGRGLIEPIDDLRATNPPSHPELMDLLALHLVEKKYDAKSLIRFITASRTYQLSATPNESNAADEKNFSRALFKRLPAEVLLDAVSDVTGVPERFEGLPGELRAVQLWDSQSQHYFLKLFGRPSRVTPCECERATGASIGQALHLMNSPALQQKLSHEGGAAARLADSGAKDDEIVESIYLTAFSRLPSAEESSQALQYLGARAANRRRAIEDLLWALMNAQEFVFNH
jgi:hypothetical protein